MTAESVARSLGGRPVGSNWMARCPVHDDTNPSLSIKEADGKVLVYCHAGCSQENVIDALKTLGLWHTESPQIEETYDYEDEGGILLYQVVRYRPKDFKQRRPDGEGGWIWKKSPRQVLYHLTEVLRSQIVIVVEGERDVETLRKNGFIATTNAGGAGTPWSREHTKALSGREVILIPDRDRAGYARVCRIAQALLGDVSRLVYLELEGGKDVTDWFSRGHSKAELLIEIEGGTLRRVLKTTEDLAALTGQSLENDSAQNSDRSHILTAHSGLDVYNSVFREPEPIIESLLYKGLTVFAARPKVGKSWFALQIAVSIAKGTSLSGCLEVRKRGRVLYIALEEKQWRTAPRLRRLTEVTEALEAIDFVYEIEPLMSGGAAQLSARLAEHPYVLVVVDTFFAFSRQSERKNVDILQADYNQINTLREICERHSCALLLIHHSRKAPGNGIDVVLGTSGVTAACDHIWVLDRKPNGDCILRVTSREIEETIYSMRLENGEPFGWRITGKGIEAELGSERRAIVDLLEDEPHTPKSIASKLNKNESTVRRLLQGLTATGLIVKVEDKYSLARAREINIMNNVNSV